jgi:hypothetical protein
LQKPGQLARWVPDVLFVLTLFFGIRRAYQFLDRSGILIRVISGFYTVLLTTFNSIETAAEHGLLFWKHLRAWGMRSSCLKTLSYGNWLTILRQLGNISTALAMKVIP